VIRHPQKGRTYWYVTDFWEEFTPVPVTLHVFQSITVDNGSEFADCDSMEKSCLNDGKRTKLFYCHPYSSWERGSNENQNKLIRRWIPKGTPIENFTDEEIARIEAWINDYPRKIFKGRAAADLFEEYAALC